MAVEPLSQHLQTIKKNAQDLQSSFPLPDKYRPAFTPADGAEVATLVSRSIYYYTTHAFVKRQPHEKLGLDIYGNPAINPYIAARLRNEAAVLHFIATHTTIPVPKVLDF